MTITLRVLSLTVIIIGVFSSVYAVADGVRAVGGDPLHFISRAAQLLL